MIQEHPADDDRGEELSLQPLHDPKTMPAPLAAMAEALRANADALRRVDNSQRKIAETIDRNNKASEVVASTRALNETFRGLSDIQRGLLDALARGRDRGGSPLVYLAVAVLVALLAVLLYDRWITDRTVPLGRFQEARAESERLRARIGGLENDVRVAREHANALDTKLQEKDRSLAAQKEAGADFVDRIKELERELEARKDRLQEYLAVKQQAELAGALQVRNASLEREVRGLQDRIGELERERSNSLEYFGEKLLELKGADPAEIKEIARKMGVYEDPAPPPEPGGPLLMTRTHKRLLLNQLNMLFPDGEDAYEVLDVKALRDRSVLEGVTLARHKNHRLVNSLTCKELTVAVDVEKDVVEIRLKHGFITPTGQPSEKIPIPAEGHSIFLPEAGLADWLRRFAGHVEVGEGGRLTWKSGPS